VSKHDKVPHHVLNIDESFRRLAGPQSIPGASITPSPLLVASSEMADGAANAATADEGTPMKGWGQGYAGHLLIDPESNNLLKTYSVAPRELGMLRIPNWTPSIKLTDQEQALVDRDGSVMVSGRSGTGKTLCLLSRMERDGRLNPHTRQLFVCRTKVRDGTGGQR
jgi:hypothetical protein